MPPIDQILGTDPLYQQLLAFDTASNTQDEAFTNQRISRMQQYYGSDSDPLSVLGRIRSALEDQNRYIANTLAAHGMINSGETGFQADRAQLAYARAEYDARLKLQDYIDGLTQALQQSERNRKFNEIQAAWQAVQNWLANNQPYVPLNVPSS